LSPLHEFSPIGPVAPSHGSLPRVSGWQLDAGCVWASAVVPASPLKAITVTAATTKHTATFNIERTAPLKH
jgi:hypothetical protein